MASVYLETLFHLYKNPVQCGKQRIPASPKSQPQYYRHSRDGTAFCHNLSDAVRQRFAAYYPGRKTQRERSATTGSAGVMRILSCCSHNQPAEVEEKSFLPAFFYGIYSVANLVCFHIFRFSQNHSFISTNPHSPTSPHMPQRNAARLRTQMAGCRRSIPDALPPGGSRRRLCRW